MGRRRQDKPRLIPEQDKRICGFVCLCQLTIVLSCVSLVYLTVAVYMPSHKAFNSGMQPVPVMCQAVNTSLVNNCDWASCGEWCLTKTSGFCPQIHVTTRHNGTKIQVTGCRGLKQVSCPPVNSGVLPKYNCNEDKVCASLTGVFNCSLGHCANMSLLFQCHYKADGIVVDSDRDNLKLNGFFECHKSRCTKIKNMRNFYCERYCNNIPTGSNNVIIQYDNNVYTGRCGKVVAYDEARGGDRGGTEVWAASEQRPHEVLLASCHTVHPGKDSDWLNATDCINGTIANSTMIPPKVMNFTIYRHLVENTTQVVDKQQSFLPMQHLLTIYNYSRLYINLEGCVNTLRGECREFLNTHGNDGDNFTAQSRFPCFYNKNDSFLVVARFDLDKTWRELLVAIIVPSTLFVVSFIALVVVAHSVKVGDDAKMRCQLCSDPPERDEELSMDGVLHRADSLANLEHVHSYQPNHNKLDD
ncbi:uncharacterized protein LOC128992353 [Macrosteles quadrilineatus]|uniref:uncharacterized protein LOC128992353 n=1 Tax=Macrosteles quadrilineatus TaxID=74068 RepID=UPI0023E22434|nr:uncharacterized protein LOC128992353 [Macrosteles quadrilineatus]